MKNSNYFTHDYDASTDRKIVKLRAKFGWKGYGIYWAIIEALAREDGYMDREGIGVAIGDVTAETIIDYCLEIDLLSKNKKEIYSKRLLEHIEIRQKYIESGKKGAEKRWGNTQAKNSPPNKPPIKPPIKPPNTSKVKKSKVKKSKVNKYSTYKKLQAITDLEIDKLIEKYGGNRAFIRSCIEDIGNWLGKNGKSGNWNDPWKNYLFGLRDWVKRDAIKIRKEQSDKSKITFINPS